MIVVDANVILRALRSRNNASHRVLRAMLAGEIAFAISPAVVLEYEDLLKRSGSLGSNPWIKTAEIDGILDAICAMGTPSLPWFRFRPFLHDPSDDLYIECCLAAGADLIVTDDRHFAHPAVAAFRITVLKASDYIATRDMKGD